MSLRLHDVWQPMLTIAVLSPLAVLGFSYGVPIEILVFGLLLAGYKGPQFLKSIKRPTLRAPSEGAPKEADARESDANDQATVIRDDAKRRAGAATTAGLTSWGAKISWRSRGSDDGKRGRDASDDTLSWRSKSSGDARARKPKAEEELKMSASKSTLSALKKQNAPQLQWRGIINKFTPEKFDKLCDQLLATLPCATGDHPVSNDEFKQVLEDLLALIFDASSRQHQYTEMYTDLCQKILDFVAKQKPDLDGKSCVWAKCQTIFQTVVLKAPEIPADLPEDEYMDRKAKLKEKMVGMVKFGGDLVSRGLVPCDGVMQWIHTLLSEKTQEVFAADAAQTPEQQAEEETVHEKDMEQREVQLEVLCAILASMGSSLSDSNTWSDENLVVIEDVFRQLEQLSMDTANLSLRIRCLIRDILDLRMAQWKEKEGKLKPGMLLARKQEDDEKADGSSRVEAVESKQWLDPQLMLSLQSVEHHVEVIEDKEAKLQRVKALIQMHHFIQEQQLVIVANSSNVKRVSDLIGESFKDIDFKPLDFNTPEQVRKKSLNNFETGETSILVMASEVSTRRDFDTNKPAAVLVNFDFPMTLQLYLYRIFKRVDSKTHVYTFFSPTFDVRHTVPLIAAMEGAKQKIPPALQKIKDQIRSSEPPPAKRDPGNRKPSRAAEAAPEWEEDGAPRGDGAPPWKSKRQGEGGRDERPGEHQWDDHRGEGGEAGRAGARTSKAKPSSAGWRDGGQRGGDHGRDDSTPAASSTHQQQHHHGEEYQGRRPDPAARKASDLSSDPPEAGGPEGHQQEGWQVKQARGSNKRLTSGRGHAGAPAQSSDGSRAERPPWSDSAADSQGDIRRTGTRGSDQATGSRSERRSDGSESWSSRGGPSEGRKTPKHRGDRGDVAAGSTGVKN